MISRLFPSKIVKPYILVGIWNSAIGIIVTAILTTMLDGRFGYILACVFGFPFVLAQAHFVQRRFVWKSHQPYLLEFQRFGITQVTGFLSMLVIITLIRETLGFEIYIAQIISIILINLITYTSMRLWVFKGENAAVREQSAE